MGSLQTNVGPDGAEAFCYEEFSVDRWVRAEGDFFKRVDFNLSESAPPPLPGVTYLSPTGALGVGLPDPPCALQCCVARHGALYQTVELESLVKRDASHV